MTISKKFYWHLSLPYRIVDLNDWFWKSPKAVEYGFVTGCKIFWMVLGYPIAWLFVLAKMVFQIFGVVFFGYPLLGLFCVGEWLWGFVDHLVPRCKKITWK